MRTSSMRSVLAALLAFLPLAAAGAEPQGEVLALTGARIYPSPDGGAILDGTVVVAGGKVVAVGPRAATAVPAGARILDCKGLVITAGFQNSHVHFTEEKWAAAAEQPAARLGAQLEAMLTRYGFTTVVDTSSLLSNTVALRRRIESGEVPGPRILTAGEGFYPPGGVPFYVKEILPPEIVELLPQPSTPEAATAIVDQHARDGADLTKLFTGSWVARGKVQPMPDDVAAAAVAATHRHGRLVVSHPSNVAGLEVALRAGVDVLAHSVEDLRGFTPEHLKRMKRQNVGLVPTLKLFGDDPHLYEILDEVRDYARIGGPILFGTDVGYLPDYDPAVEYRLLQTAGLGWREILASLTTTPAARFQESTRRGRIAPGLDADLVVLGSDPMLALEAFTDIRHVVRGGRVIYSAPGKP